MLTSLAEALFPSRCAACRKLAGGPQILCAHCLSELEPVPPQACRVCCDSGGIHHDGLCGRCTAHLPPFDELRAAFAYGGPMREALLALKHSGHLETGHRLGRLAASTLPAPERGIVVPVPLHGNRLGERGYNQALLIARGMAAVWRLPVHTDLLLRIRDTGSHRGRTALQRRASLAGAFLAPPDRVPESATIILVDDVAASRSTAVECSLALKAAGARRVLVRVVAASLD
ncbi:MAG: ComF family protein [Deltaproteobacteria bacterium]|nr:ComF family protein [Deltaproteobacteria bacterium]